VQVFTLERAGLMSVLSSGEFPDVEAALARAKQWIVLKWGLLMWARWVLAQVRETHTHTHPPRRRAWHTRARSDDDDDDGRGDAERGRARTTRRPHGRISPSLRVCLAVDRASRVVVRTRSARSSRRAELAARRHTQTHHPTFFL